MNLEPLLQLYGDTLRIRIGLWAIIIAVWSAIWFYRFFKDWLAGDNGATFALWVFFAVMALERFIEGFGFVYLATPYVTPLISGAILQAREVIILAVLISLAVLQWRFTSGPD